MLLTKNKIIFNYMIERIFKKANKKGAEKYLYFSAPFLHMYFPKRKNLIKNYIFEPDYRLLKSK